MKWFQRNKPTDPAAEYIEELNRQAEEKEKHKQAATHPPFPIVCDVITGDKIMAGTITSEKLKTHDLIVDGLVAREFRRTS